MRPGANLPRPVDQKDRTGPGDRPAAHAAPGKGSDPRIDTLATATTERVQQNMETARDEAVTRFVSRLREQVTPLLAEANDALQTLAVSEAAFKNESRAFIAGIEKQIATGADASVAKAQQDLAQTANSVAEKTTETLQQLSQNIEKAAQGDLNSLLASLGGNVTKLLEERTAEISREFTTGIETYTRNYLEQIGKSIAEIPKNTQGQSNQSVAPSVEKREDRASRPVPGSGIPATGSKN